MAGGEGIRIEGAARLRRTLKAAGDDLSDLREANQAAVGIVTSAGRARTPRRTGRLASSVRGSATARIATVRAGGAAVPYAGPIHWGWPARGIAAQPFLSEAARETEPRWIGLYEAAVETAINKVEGI